MLLAPAIWDGFPFLFGDTGTYIDAAVQRDLPGERTMFYSLFIFPLHLKISLWPVVVVQALIAFNLIRLFFRVFSERFQEHDILLPVFMLVALSSLPWFAGEIMPDIVSGPLILTIAAGVIGQRKLLPYERILLPLLVAFFITTHLSYLLIGGGTFARCCRT
jgi:predicted CDP-diglyceride synthetase/phosphatidate cytidylyltransferase